MGQTVKHYETAYIEERGRAAWVFINRPRELNANNLQLMFDLESAFRWLELSDNFDVVVLTGVGDKAFCAGGDLKMIYDCTKNPDEAYKMLSQMMRTVYSIKSLGKPVIGRVNGIAIGGAGELLMPCDIIIAAEHAKFILGETSAGAVPFDGTTQWLTLAIGEKRAKYTLLTDEPISAQTMCDWGLVNKVVPMDKLDEEVGKVTKSLLDKAPWAMRLIKTQANTIGDLATNSIMAGRDSWTLLTLVPGLAKSCQAFANKKKPEWANWRVEELSNDTGYYLWGPNTKKCEKCGAENLPQNMVFCGVCGAKL